MKKIHLTFLWLAIVAVFTACKTEVDDVFEKSSAERITEAMAKCRETLVGAKNGWVMEYYADTQYGGYNVLAKFNDNSTVTVQNEAYLSNETRTSHFKVEQSQGVVLSFDEYNAAFHFFSDPHNPAAIGDDGKGMRGDFEFRVIKMSADSILLKGKKHGSRILMTPLKEGDNWNEYLAKVKATEKSMQYSAYTLQLGDKEYRVGKSYRELRFTDPTTGNVQKMPFIQTAEGMKLYRPITFEGKQISGFTYSDDDKWLNPADKSVALLPYIPPLVEQFTTNMWFVSYSKLGEFAKPYWDKLKKGATEIEGGPEVIQVAIVGLAQISKAQKEPAFGLSLISSGYGAVYKFSFEKVSDTSIKLWYNTGMDLDGSFYDRKGNYSVATVPFGTKEQPRTFTLSADNLKSPTYITLTDEKEPTNVITLLKKQVVNPFDH